MIIEEKKNKPADDLEKTAEWYKVVGLEAVISKIKENQYGRN